MGSAVCRVGDIVQGTCRASVSGHPREFTGVWLTGSDTCTADGLGVVRVGDIGVTDCDHHFSAVSGSDVGIADGVGIHRVGDAVSIAEGGEGVSVSGSDTFISD